MFIIGLTGGIGSGKSTIASWFRDWHIPVIDGDKLAREAVNPGSPVLSILADAFGKEILSEEGTLKRRQLGQIVFQDKAKLSRLNQIMHPAIWHLVESRIKACKDAEEKLAVLDMPLLIEEMCIRDSHDGPFVKWLRHRPFTAGSRVRISSGSPAKTDYVRVVLSGHSAVLKIE